MASAEGIIRVVLCDDAVGFPDLVASWLKAADGVELAGRTASEAELVELLGDGAADVVLLDFMLPEGPTDEERMRRLRALAPGARIVLISSLPEMQLQDEAARLGADAWCSKATVADELLEAVRG